MVVGSRILFQITYFVILIVPGKLILKSSKVIFLLKDESDEIIFFYITYSDKIVTKLCTIILFNKKVKSYFHIIK